MDLKTKVIRISVVIGCVIATCVIGYLIYFVINDTLKPIPQNTVTKNLFIEKILTDIARLSKTASINDNKILYNSISLSLKEDAINDFIPNYQYQSLWKKLNYAYTEQFILLVEKYFGQTEWKSNYLVSEGIRYIKNTGFVERNTPIWIRLDGFEKNLYCYNQMQSCIRRIHNISNNLSNYIPIEEISDINNKTQNLINQNCIKNTKIQKILISSYDYLERETKAFEILDVTPTILEFDASGGNKTITINTNLSLWSNSAVYSWLEISKNMNSLTVTCEKNITTVERTDFFEIKGFKKSTKIDIKQKAKSNYVSGNIDNTWVDHNIYQNGKKGLKIHIKFTVNNMKGNRGYCNAYFYFQDGNKLKDLNNSYKSIDGQVSVGDSFTPSFDNYSGDFILFMPYNELHLVKGSYKLKFNIAIFDQNIKQIAISEYLYFDLNQN